MYVWDKVEPEMIPITENIGIKSKINDEKRLIIKAFSIKDFRIIFSFSRKIRNQMVENS